METPAKLDFIIDSRTNDLSLIDIPSIGLEQQNKPATFDYYLNEYFNIKSITLKSISFYNSWYTHDFFKGNLIDKTKIINGVTFVTGFPIPKNNLRLTEFCRYFEETLEKRKIEHVKLNCENNYLVIELTDDIEFKLIDTEIGVSKFESFVIDNIWYGFKQETFNKKGKYYSTKPLNFYRTDLFLRCNLIDKQSVFYNNKPSDILCIFPVEDGDQIKFQRYEPINCTKEINKITNHIKFEITDETGKVVNFRGMPVLINLSFNK
jgi:hypothetical protein